MRSSKCKTISTLYTLILGLSTLADGIIISNFTIEEIIPQEKKLNLRSSKHSIIIEN